MSAATGKRFAAPLLALAVTIAVGQPSLARSPSAIPTSSVPAVALESIAAWSTWYQIERGASGATVLWTGRVNGRAQDVARVVGPIGAAAVTSRSEASEVIAWWSEGLGGVIRRILGDGSIVPLLETEHPVASATASGDGRWVVWATSADDGGIRGVMRRHINIHANQEVGRLAGPMNLSGTRLFADRSAALVVVAGTTPDASTGVWLLTSTGEPATQIPVPAHGVALGLMGRTLVIGMPSEDETAGPPFTFVELPSMATTRLDAGVGSHAMLTRDGWLAWETPGPDGNRSILTVATPAAEPDVVWTLDPTDGAPSLHLVGATTDTGYGGQGWVALFPAGRPYQGPDADPAASAGTFVRLAQPGVATVPAVLPPLRQGQPWFPILESEQPMAIDAATHVFDGWLAIGRTGYERTFRLWHSSDGRTWTERGGPIPVGAEIGTLHLYSRGRTVILAGGEDGGDGPNRVRIWTSLDAGRSWTAVPSGPLFGAGPAGPAEIAYANASVRDIGRLGGRYAVVGMFCVESCQRPTLWTSRDLRTWTRTPLRPRVGDAAPDYLTNVTIGRDRLLSTFWPDDASGPGTRLASSPDGRRWADLGPTPDTEGFPEVVDARGGLTIVGSVGDGGPATIWRSKDGRSWAQVYQDTSAWGVRDVAVSGGWSPSMVVIGVAEVEPGTEDMRNAALVSIDGGPWERSAGWMTPSNSRADVAVFGGNEVVVLGSSEGGGYPAGWRTELQSDRDPIGASGDTP